jgi:hypothetical protein
MSANETILTIISIASPLVAVGSTIWSLTKEASTKNEKGEKRLTFAGRVAAALACVSAVLAVTSVGFKTLIDNDKVATQLRDKKLAADEKARVRKDEANWRAFNDNQQRALNKLGIDVTREQGARVVGNQDLLAAIEEQRDSALAANARLFQIAQSQRIVLEGQPLGSLQISLTFGGFTDAEFKKFEDGFDEVADYPETDDYYGNLADAKIYYDNSNIYRKVFLPLLQMLMNDAGDADKPTELILAVDIDGTGAWLLPIGVTTQNPSRGLVFNDAWLSAKGDPNGVMTEAIKQEMGACTFPHIQLNKRRREVSLSINLQGNCLPFAIHRAGSSSATAKLTSRPATVVYRNGKELFPLKAENVADIDDWISGKCWDATGPTGKVGKYIQLVAIPNRSSDLAVARTLHLVGVGEMTYWPTTYDRRDDWDAGRCAQYR